MSENNQLEKEYQDEINALKNEVNHLNDEMDELKSSILNSDNDNEAEVINNHRYVKNTKEEIYDRINIPVKSLDIIIKILFGMLILALALGIYFGNR